MELSTRRGFLASAPWVALAQTRRPPNVILCISDDQGYGDLSLHGNPNLKTPNLDRIGVEGVQFTQFQVSPVCSPTRSSLMTGRYNYRTGVVDTYIGRSMMYPDEETLAEVLRRAGYVTGIFGKWHLGDCYPLRAMDQGFDESVVCTGGGLTQPSDPPGNRYHNPLLKVNGKWERRDGYCTDIFFREALRFVERNRRRPFFTYLAANAPHTPLEIDDDYWRPFAAQGLNEVTSKVYGMCRNLDDNMGRLHATLERLGLAENTILIFLTDNGPQQQRYNAGMRGLKGSVYQGGIRVPFLMRWPARFKAAKTDRIAAHIDVMPTLAEACGAKLPAGRKIDGRSLMPLLRGDDANWPDRTLYTQWHRGDVPELFRACAARTQQYKLVDGKELYDLASDPAEQHDIAAQNPNVVSQMRQDVERWFRDVSAERGYDPPRIHLGSRQEPHTTLTRQDWRGSRAGWRPGDVGHWEVEVVREGNYQVTVRFPAAAQPGEASVKVGDVSGSGRFAAGAESASFPLRLRAGPARLEPGVSAGAGVSPTYVDVSLM